MNKDECFEKVNALWGGTIYGFNFDLLLHNIVINVILPSEKVSKFYELRFINVFKMSFDKNCALPGWNYVELLEIHVKKKNSPVIIEIFLWDDEQKLIIECEKFEMV